MRVPDDLRAKPPDHPLETASRLGGDIAADDVNKIVEVIRSIRDLIVHLSRDPVAGLLNLGNDRVRSEPFPAVPVESDPPSRDFDRFKSITSHDEALDS